MDALLVAFVASFVAEWGDKTQLLVAFLSARASRSWPVMLGLLAALIISNGVAAYGAEMVARLITPQAIQLLLAVALLFAGVAAFIRAEEPSLGSARTPLLIAAFILCLAAEIGDRTQFITFASAGHFRNPVLAAAGATAGAFAAAIPAAMAGRNLVERVPLRAIRLAGGAVFLIAGFLVAVTALRLV